jgi:hypothetical protein
MDVSAIAPVGLPQASSGVEKAMDKLSSTPNPVDAVNLSLTAATMSQQHIAYSLDIKAMKVADEMASLAINIIG